MASGRSDRLGVYQIDGDTGADVMEQSGGGIDIERRADDDKDVGLGGVVRSDADVGHRLAEEHDVGPQQRAVAGFRSRLDAAVVRRQRLPVARVFRVAAGADFHQFAVEVDDV